jgi:ubiquinone/menaquinone biosynthesis C-methylase UbiE
MGTDAAVTRPMRRDCAAAYDRGVDGFINVWSAVILPPAHAVVAALELQPGARVMDVGAGTGALVPTILAHALGSQVVAVDASIEMPRAAKVRTDASVAHADALTLPTRSNCAQAVLMAYVLDDTVPAGTLARAQQRLASLEPHDFAWSGGVVCAVATR